jgi:hypothetical protein
VPQNRSLLGDEKEIPNNAIENRNPVILIIQQQIIFISLINIYIKQYIKLLKL